MMVFWMLVRMCKFEIPYEMPTALRYAWYLYYIPMLLLPTVSLYLAFYIRQPENYKLPERRCLLFFPALFLIGIVLTNDLHQLIFIFPEGRHADIFHNEHICFHRSEHAGLKNSGPNIFATA